MTGNLYKVRYEMDRPGGGSIDKWWTNFGWSYESGRAVCLSYDEAVRVVGRLEGVSPSRLSIEPVLVGQPPRSLISVYVQAVVQHQLALAWGQVSEDNTEQLVKIARGGVGSEMGSVQWDDLVRRLPVEFRHLLEGKNPFGEVY